MSKNLTKLTELLKAHVSNAAKTLEIIEAQLSENKPEPDIPPFGENIKTLRRQHNVTQLDLCAALDITQYELSGYERDIIKPDIETVLKMANYFGVSVDCLLRGADNE